MIDAAEWLNAFNNKKLLTESGGDGEDEDDWHGGYKHDVLVSGQP